MVWPRVGLAVAVLLVTFLVVWAQDRLPGGEYGISRAIMLLGLAGLAGWSWHKVRLRCGRMIHHMGCNSCGHRWDIEESRTS
jgi:hypothetical protein